MGVDGGSKKRGLTGGGIIRQSTLGGSSPNPAQYAFSSPLIILKIILFLEFITNSSERPVLGPLLVRAAAAVGATLAFFLGLDDVRREESRESLFAFFLPLVFVRTKLVLGWSLYHLIKSKV